MREIEVEGERTPEIVWEFYCKTKYGNNIFIGAIPKTNEFKACSDAEPWFHVPADQFDKVESQIKFMLEAYGDYRKLVVVK